MNIEVCVRVLHIYELRMLHYIQSYAFDTLLNFLKVFFKHTKEYMLFKMNSYISLRWILTHNHKFNWCQVSVCVFCSAHTYTHSWVFKWLDLVQMVGLWPWSSFQHNQMTFSLCPLTDLWHCLSPNELQHQFFLIRTFSYLKDNMYFKASVI